MVTLSRQVDRPVSRAALPSHDALLARLRRAMSLCSRLSHPAVSHAMSSFSRRRPASQCPVSTGPPRPLSRHTVARTSSSSTARSPRLVAQPRSLSCSRSHVPVARAVSLSCARLSNPVARARSRSAPAFIGKVSFAMNASACRFPDPRSARCRPVSRTTTRAPFMDPEAMPLVRSRSYPRKRTNRTARVAHTWKPIFPPVSRTKNRPHARVARAMKPSRSLRLPESSSPTSLHGAPAPPAELRRPVSRSTKPTRRHGALAQRCSLAAGCPDGEATALHGSPVASKRLPVIRFPEPSTAAPSHRLLERWDRADRPVARTIHRGPTALIRL